MTQTLHYSAPRPPEDLFKEARRRRRRRWTATVSGAVIVTAVVVGLVVGGRGGRGDYRPTWGTSGSAKPQTPLRQHDTAPPGGGIVGQGPTAIDFLDPDHGWIATGGSGGYLAACRNVNPTVVQTVDAGATWTSLPVPNELSQNTNYSVWQQYGGVIGLHFVDRLHGWFWQGGQLWRTDDGGHMWVPVLLDRAKGVTVTALDLTATPGGLLALALVCPNDQPVNACSHLFLFRSTPTGWTRGSALPFSIPPPPYGPGLSSFIAAGQSTFVFGTAGKLLEVQPDGHVRPADSSCTPIGALSGGVAGICNTGGGGNASSTSIAVSDDQGRSWVPLASGPSTDQWVGTPVTNGADAILYITGGQTLWRWTTSSPGWVQVLQAPPGSTASFSPPQFFAPAFGVIGESGGPMPPQLFVTHDDGATWSPLSASSSG